MFHLANSGFILFAQQMFGEKTKVRFRPHPTEPSAKLIFRPRQNGCRTCSGTGWIEILGAGAVDLMLGVITTRRIHWICLWYGVGCYDKIWYYRS